ncbi:MAG: sugar phosphate nucleotidyltransferase [Candidatus Dojkabacteria bacterium]|nr:MAG: sugar phosphate nucleotidyltransferase [Candidatus Dojkabacteria bacterium]
MKIILFAGGTGKRFWPVSRVKSPKQFLAIIEDKPLLRIRYDLLREAFPASDIFVSLGQQYRHEVEQIIPELPKENIIAEPMMRDTGPAVGLAIAYVTKMFPDEVIMTQWTDHHIKDPIAFITAIKKAEEVVKQEKKTVFLAVPARFPSPHRGYIHFGKVLDSQYGGQIKLAEFERFVEKPTMEVAKEYIAAGTYGWNPGYWAAFGQDFLKGYKDSAREIYDVVTEMVESDFSEESCEKFSKLEKISADYAYAEYLKPEDARVLLADIGWSDIGEWIALKETLESSPESNVAIGPAKDMGSEDTLIYNTEADKLVVTIGLKGFVVVNTKDVVAIFHKNDNTKLKEFLAQLEKDPSTVIYL